MGMKLLIKMTVALPTLLLLSHYIRYPNTHIPLFHHSRAGVVGGHVKELFVRLFDICVRVCSLLYGVAVCHD